MVKRVLITGGAGFIGSHLVDNLVDNKGYEVSVLDNLVDQVHGNKHKPPDYLNKKAKFILGSVTNYKILKDIIEDSDIVIHLAAMVGVGQSMYKIKDYIDNNILGSANLLDILVNSNHNVKKVIIASSNTVYGEGKSHCNKCGEIFPKLRSLDQLNSKDWDLNCPKCGSKLSPLLTNEDTPLNPSSIYAFSKQAQEKLGLMIGNTYGIDTTVLRFFLTYGTRQALSNPYTGVCAIFCARVFNGKPPIVFEDGDQSRDFVNVNDICQAIILAMDKNASSGEVFNVGTGMPIKIKEVAEIITKKINPDIKPIINQDYRIGDIRHCIADISKIKNKLGYKPLIPFNEGIDDLIEWIKTKGKNLKDNSEIALNKLKEKGLLK